MKYRWLFRSLLPGLVGLMLSATPAEAGRLQFWRFDRDANRLTFTTDDGVQPTAQLIANPTRLVIDLPQTSLGSSSTARQAVGGLIREVRAGQFDSSTARIVIEIAPGYTIDPNQVQIRGLSPSQWTVELPTPQRVDPASTAQSPPTTPAAPASTPSSAAGETEVPDPVNAPIQVTDLRVTADGLFIQTRGGEPEILDIDRDRDRRDREIRIDLGNASIAPRLTLNQRDQTFDRPDIDRLQIEQLDDDPAVVRVTLTLPERAPDWDINPSNLGGLVLIPRRGTTFVAGERPVELPRTTDTNIRVATPDQIATIRSVQLAENETQLLIESDGALTYTSQYNQNENAYEIRIPSAQLAEEVEGPELTEDSPLTRLRLRQEEGNVVVVLVQPAAGIQFGNVTRPEDDTIAIQLQRGSTTATAPPPSTTGTPIPVPQPSAVPPETRPAPSLPSVRNERIVVVIDPGHGGRDPGAVGIGGLQEKDVIFPIAREVAALLEQQGVQVIMTRTDDREIDLEPRVQIAERANASLFVSIHANAISLSRPDVNGLETYYYSSGQRLAQVIHNAILQNVAIQDRGVRQARFYVLRNTSMPAILIETGFVTGAEDSRRLADPTQQRVMAAAITQGILQYIQQNF
ncbi:MAG: N-acetylmuramoyl-L-alanine amidase [Thainema sp.]